MNSKKIFVRKETKYLLTKKQFDSFINDLIINNMKIDEHGLHTILSLYFDTNEYKFIKHSMTKPIYKEKFRVRSYGIPGDNEIIFLEIKKKVNGIVYKRRISMEYEVYCTWQESGFFPEKLVNNQIGMEISWLFRQHTDLVPKVLIAYDRLSLFIEDDSEFRVTFDQNIRYRNQNLVLANGSHGEIVAPELDVLMEVKAMGSYPLWFVELLNKYGVRKSSFSKYAQTFERHLFIEEEMKYVS